MTEHVVSAALAGHELRATSMEIDEERQLRPAADDITGHLVQDCGHIVPLDRPEALLRLPAPSSPPTSTTDRVIAHFRGSRVILTSAEECAVR
ncbi:hypothetical protein [Amycolatopsis cihanbeyliensis]|uniref:hypothetical protein n=1 Tax=Amycolatopsis cihanbeyliensis TaxID=1128664 RepID=UPI001FE6E8F5|nr:hypothetical protein [Amycolatopsis cihanbeyliensis]